MVFPFPRGVHDDLKDLVRDVRLREHARNLGLSSIGPGGSLDVVDGSGNVVASIGDVGGAQSFGLRSGGVVQDIRGVFADTGRVSDAEDRLDNHAQRIGATENVANAVSSEVTGARGGFGNLSGRFDSHATRLGATEGVANGARSELNTARGGFASVGARLNDHVSRIGASESSLNAARGGFPTLAARLDDHLTRLNGAQAEILQIKSDLAWVKNQIVAIRDFVNMSPVIPP